MRLTGASKSALMMGPKPDQAPTPAGKEGGKNKIKKKVGAKRKGGEGDERQQQQSKKRKTMKDPKAVQEAGNPAPSSNNESKAGKIFGLVIEK